LISVSPKLRWSNASGHSANASGPATSASYLPSLVVVGEFHGAVVALAGEAAQRR